MTASRLCKAHRWLCEYVGELNYSECSRNTDLSLKLVGEFSLLCYLMKRMGKLPADFTDVLHKVTQTIPQSFHFGPFIKSCFDVPIEKHLISDKKGIEHSYLRYLFVGERPNWAQSICVHLDSMTKKEEGISRESAYLLTHLIFYSTDFGKSDYWKTYPDLKMVLKDILKLCEDKYREAQNWDLLRELYLSKLYLSPELSSEIAQAVSSEDRLVASEQGWFLSDGLRLKHYEANYLYLSEEEKYSLFHTTLVSLLLYHSIYGTISPSLNDTLEYKSTSDCYER